MITLTGQNEFVDKLKALKQSSPEVERAAVVAGCAVMASACRQASRGSIVNECGFRIKEEGGKVTGRAGLVRFPRRGRKGRQPHGVYLTLGTKFYAAERFIQSALASSQQRAIAAMSRAAKGRIRAIARSGG